MIKKVEKEKKENLKIAQKKIKEETKQQEKETKQKEKEAIKNAIKDLKKIVIKSKVILQENNSNIIHSTNDVEGENVVITSNIVNNSEGCTQIIKTGLNKGKACGIIILNDCLCKRHYNLKNKDKDKDKDKDI